MTQQNSDDHKPETQKETTSKTDVHELQEQLAAMEQNWKRALADYQNAQKRQQQQQQMQARLACIQLVERILPAIDHLELAAKHIEDTGLQMVVKQFEDALSLEGISVIEAMNKDFDPTTMECVDKSEGPENKVISVVAKGYKSGNYIIRPAKVQVGTNKSK